AYRYLAERLQEWNDSAADLVAKAQGLERAASYTDAFTAVGAFDESLRKTEHLTAGYGPLYRSLLAAAAQRDAEAASAARQPTAARYYGDLAARLQNATGAFDDNRIESGYAAAAFAQRLHAYDAVVGADAQIAWVMAQVPDGLVFRGGPTGRGQNWTEQQQNFFLADLVQARHAEELRLADQLRQNGRPARAALHALAAAAIVGARSWEPFHCAEAFAATDAPPASLPRVLQTLAPLLRDVLPPIGHRTGEGQRLAEMLREGTCLDWPLVHDLGFCLDPGDLAKSGVVADRHLVLERRGDTFVLATRDAPQGPADAVSFLQRLSGVSAETIAEEAALAAEAAAIDTERQQIAAEKAAVDPMGDALAAAEQAIEAARAGSSASDEALRAFNQRVDAHNVEVRTLRPRQDALRGRIAALNARIAAYNPRVAVNNERRMRERAAGGAKVDALLRTALDQWFTERLGVYEGSLRAKGLDDAAVADEMRCARWWLGREAARPQPAFATFRLDSHRRLRREAIERLIHQHPTNESLAAAVVDHWVLSQDPYARAAGGKFFGAWAKTFRWERDIRILQAAIAARTDLSDVQRSELQALITAAERR
ncbi:MAG: hypothetical protein JNK15_23940, partial [Planctomycetes bacterium]|nr:hypothetical protein [Planctomycetota bacterium]